MHWIRRSATGGWPMRQSGCSRPAPGTTLPRWRPTSWNPWCERDSGAAWEGTDGVQLDVWRFERRAVLLGEEVPLGVFARGVDAKDVDEAGVSVGGQTARADPAEVDGVSGGGDRQQHDVTAALADPGRRRRGRRRGHGRRPWSPGA